jgi:hypothetical protein
MAKIFICDNCKKEFSSPLDEEKYKADDGTWYTFDLCAPCRGEKKSVEETAKKNYFDKLLKKDK